MIPLALFVHLFWGPIELAPKAWVLKTLGNIYYIFQTVLQYSINYNLNQMSINMSENHSVEY